MTSPLPLGAKVVVGAFLVSGTVHILRPRTFEPLMPSWVPAHREVIIGSGVAELACAAGMLAPPTRRWAGLASAALLVAVFPGNVQMAVDADMTLVGFVRSGGFNIYAGAHRVARDVAELV